MKFAVPDNTTTATYVEKKKLYMDHDRKALPTSI